MDLPANAFKRAIASGTRVHGTWLVSGAASTAEALGCAGFDFLVVDTEHTPIETPQVAEILRTIAGTPASAIVRPAWNDMVLIKRLLDAGAQSLLVPFVQSAEEARRAVSYTRYPPDGVRGVAAVQRGSRFGTVPNYLKGAGAEICVIVQIETLTALDATRSSSDPAISPRHSVIWETSPIRPCSPSSSSPRRRAAKPASRAASSAPTRRWSGSSSSTAIRGLP
jgi:2-keto-3-deoxy-L-rhamnonate aldolase RhmA